MDSRAGQRQARTASTDTPRRRASSKANRTAADPAGLLSDTHDDTAACRRPVPGCRGRRPSGTARARRRSGSRNRAAPRRGRCGHGCPSPAPRRCGSPAPARTRAPPSTPRYVRRVRGDGDGPDARRCPRCPRRAPVRRAWRVPRRSRSPRSAPTARRRPPAAGLRATPPRRPPSRRPADSARSRPHPRPWGASSRSPPRHEVEADPGRDVAARHVIA